MNVAIAHEKFTGHGGAQNVAFELARTFDAPIYAGWVDDEYTPDDVDIRQVFSERSKRMLQAPTLLTDAYHMLRWSWVNALYDYDVVILNKTNVGWFVPAPHQTIIHYVHSPPRTTFDRWHESKPGYIQRLAAIAQRTIYEHTWNYPDAIVTNSETVANRMRTYLDREPTRVVNPPVDTDAYDVSMPPTQDYYLTLGRLDHNKNVPGIVETCERVGVPCVVAGDGPQLNTVKQTAGRYTTVHGAVSEAKKRALYSGAKAFIMHASQEDFGLTPIEAMASGTPVLGVREGYTQHQIEHGKNGLLYDRSGPTGGLANVIAEFETNGVDLPPQQIASHAGQYDTQTFQDAMHEVVADVK